MITSPGSKSGIKLLDEIVHRRPGLDQEHDPAGFLLQKADQFREGMGTQDPGAFGPPLKELVHPGCGAVVNGHRESMVVHVQHEVLSHDCQADEADVRLAHLFLPFVILVDLHKKSKLSC